MKNTSDLYRDECMLKGKLATKGYDWWWHSFTGVDKETKEEKSFFIEYFLCNPGRSVDEPVFGQLPANKKKHIAPSYLMVKAGAWGEDGVQLHRFFAWKDVCLKARAPYEVKAGDCYASETRLKGSVHVSVEDAKSHPEYMSDAGEMEWDLHVDKRIPFNVGYGASKLFRDINAFEMYWHAEGMKTLYAGEILFNGRTYEVTEDTSYGYADKNWGGDFTSPWIWLSSNCLRSKRTGKVLTNSVFDIGGGKPKVFGVPLSGKLLGAFYYQGELMEFNFSKFWTGCKTQFDCYETTDQIVWHVKQETHKYLMQVNIHCDKKDMLLVNYEAPNGKKQHNRLWNGGTGQGRIKLYRKKLGKWKLVDDIIATHVGCEYGEFTTK